MDDGFEFIDQDELNSAVLVYISHVLKVPDVATLTPKQIRALLPKKPSLRMRLVKQVACGVGRYLLVPAALRAFLK